MNIYLPQKPRTDDYQSIRSNGMWYRHWQSGYEDILKKGHPRPEDEDTILAELYSPHTEDFLHGGDVNVPFIISEKAISLFSDAGFTGYRLASVEVAKVATNGNHREKVRPGEPEDAISRNPDVRDSVDVPVLHAVYVTGRVSATLDFPSGRAPCRYVSPFDFAPDARDYPDLFNPEYQGRRFSAWTFCSARFQRIVSESGLTNIDFQPFDDFMVDFRRQVADKGNT